jgi:hypothetical protein
MNYETLRNNSVLKYAFDPFLRKTAEQLTENRLPLRIQEATGFTLKMGVVKVEL